MAEAVIDPDSQLAARHELQPGEVLRWTGRPPAARLGLRGMGAFVFAIPWTAFSVFWMWMAAGQKVPDLRGGSVTDYFWLWGVPFLLVGVWMLLTPLRWYLQAASTIYAVTDRRALVITKGRSRKVKSYGPSEVAQLERKERADGSGDLLFRIQRDERQRYPISADFPDAFIGIRDARTVEQILMDIVRAGGKASS